MHYVAGFAFTPDARQVALVRKARPAWQAGRLNGIGGKLEPGETPLAAMVREFREETGVVTAPSDWREAVVLRFDGGCVHFFTARLSGLSGVRAITDEAIEVHPSLPVPVDALPNLTWLIPLCLDNLAGPIAIFDQGGARDLRAALAAA
jgi:8-oxo-dGTP diphosphatase